MMIECQVVVFQEDVATVVVKSYMLKLKLLKSVASFFQ